MVRSIAVDEKALAGNNFDPIPDGTRLKVSVFDIKEGVTGANSKKPGSPQAEFTVKVTEDGPYKGREIRYNYLPLYAGAGNAWFLTAFAEAVGWNIDKESKSVEVPDDLNEVLGTEFIAVIGTQDSQKINAETGKPYVNNRVRSARKIKAGGGGITEKAEAPGWESL